MPYSKVYEQSSNLQSLSSDIDKFRTGFITDEVEEDGSKINISFASPYFSTLEKYRYYLYSNCKTKILDKKNYYRPDYVSFEEYGTTNYWALILFINDIASIDEFVSDNILIPSVESLNRISGDNIDLQYKSLGKSKFDWIDNRGILYMPPVTSQKPSDITSLFNTTRSDLKYVDSTLVEQLNSSVNDLFVKEDFILDIPTLRLRYVDLKFEAVAKSVIVQIKNKKSVIYGKHYLLTTVDSEEKRLSWDPKVITDGVGMVFFLKELDHIQVSYVKKV